MDAVKYLKEIFRMRDSLKERFWMSKILSDWTKETITEIRKTKELDGIKILGNGNLEKKLTIQAHKFSNSAVEKIEASGSKIEVI